MKAFPKLEGLQSPRVATQDVTLKDFSGGLKLTDANAILNSRFAVVLSNMFVEEDFAQQLRYGTKLRRNYTSAIIDAYYFSGNILTFHADGTIFAFDNVNTPVAIWNNAIAATLPGSPLSWATGVTHIDHAEQDGKLIVHNDRNKPIIIGDDLTVDYLQDLATNTNINTPIGRHCATVDKYHVIASGTEPDLFISATGASGTYVGDPIPNDSLIYSLGSYAPTRNRKIVACKAFKGLLFVFFVTSIVIVRLGKISNTGDHTPEVVDVLDSIGAISHRSIFTTEKDIVVYTRKGVYRIRRNSLGTAFEPIQLTSDIDPLLSKNLPKVGSAAGYSFALQDNIAKKSFFFVRTEADAKIVLACSSDSEFKKTAWSPIDGWDFDGGCFTENDRVFFFKGTKLYQYGNKAFTGEDYYSDFLADATVNGGLGTPITFDWESSWLDANARLRTKDILKVTGDTIGEADFFLDIFVDNIYKDSEGNYDPAVSLELRAGSVGGYGTPSVGYGGGRRFSDERYFGFPVRCKIFKFRVHGSATKKLTIGALSFIYRTGTYHR